jgi:hypothetical protein
MTDIVDLCCHCHNAMPGPLPFVVLRRRADGWVSVLPLCGHCEQHHRTDVEGEVVGREAAPGLAR